MSGWDDEREGRYDPQWAQMIVNDVESRGEGLNDWECEFMESIVRRLEGNRRLTDDQEITLSKIHEERC